MGGMSAADRVHEEGRPTRRSGARSTLRMAVGLVCAVAGLLVRHCVIQCANRCVPSVVCHPLCVVQCVSSIVCHPLCVVHCAPWQDFKKRKGVVSKAKFKTAMVVAGLPLSQPEYNALEQKYVGQGADWTRLPGARGKTPLRTSTHRTNVRRTVVQRGGRRVRSCPRGNMVGSGIGTSTGCWGRWWTTRSSSQQSRPPLKGGAASLTCGKG